MDSFKTDKPFDFRRLAENLESAQNGRAKEDGTTGGSEETEQLIHELRVHQIQLELQNEELRSAQLELELTRTRYFDLYDLAPVGYCTLNPKGLILEANLTSATMLGTQRASLVNQLINRFIVKDDQDVYYLHCQNLLAKDEKQICELRMVKKDRSEIWVRMTMTSVLDAHGKPAVAAALNDITQNIFMQKAMQESEERYRTLVEWSPEPVLVHRSGIIIYINPAAIRMFGAPSANEVVGKNLLDLVMPDSNLPVLGSQMYEQQYLKLDGTVIDVEVRTTLIIYDGIPAMYVAMRNVSEKKLQEKNLLENIAELETARLVAETANLAKSDFLSSMSHDLRTPLNAILGFAQLIESGTPEPTPSQKRSIEQILKAGWYLLQLINKILDLALIESGKLILTMESISLEELIQECLTMLEGQAEKRRVTLRFTPPGFYAFVYADRIRLKQVLINLLSNGIKYNKSGGEVTIGAVSEGPTVLSVFVRDTGIGLSPEQLSQLFEPFNRLGQMASVEEGTGIGLVVCKRLVGLMGGHISVESTLGTGSVFHVVMNHAEGSVTEREDARAETKTKTETIMDAAAADNAKPRYSILYVEDNQANLMLVEDLIARRSDIRFLSAIDAAHGIEIARASQPDLVLMDINLPGMNGIQALKILSNDPSTSHIPVVAVSANAIPRDIERGLEAGFVRYITKPIKVTEFMETIDALLHRE